MVAVAAMRALGTSASVAVTDAAALEQASEILRQELEAIDLACSRFREDSEISRLAAARGPLPTSPLCRRAVRAALRAAAASDGLVDPTVGNAMIAIGYDRDFALLLQSGPAPVPEHVPGWRAVRVDDIAGTVQVPAGVQLDLGATAKALAADQAAARIAAATGAGVLVNLGGDIAIAGRAPEAGFAVRVTDDHAAAADAPGQTVSLTSGGLATSSTTVRRWRRDSIEVHHIVDPRTGLPAATPWRTVSVTAATCVDANTASTAAMVLGAEAPAWLLERGLPARLVDRDGSVLHLAGWPEAGESAP